MRDETATVRPPRGAPLFSSFTVRELDAVIETSDLVEYQAGDVIFREGDEGDELFLIVSGSVRVSHITEDGLERPIAILGPGTCLGEMAFLDGGARSATAVATGPLRLRRVSHEGLDSVECEYPETRVKFLEQGVRLLSRRLRDSNSSYWDLANRAIRTQMDVAQSRSRLLSLVSHELRTPLTIIKSSAQVLRRGESGPRADFVEKIHRQADHLQLLIEDLITLALLRDASSITEATEFDSGALVLEVAHELAGRAREKEVRISVSREEEQTLVVADRALLRGAFRHLVGNAVKFAPRGSRIRLEASVSDDGEARISVQDEGEGIPEDALARLRQSFVQSQDPLNRDIDGLGIGLALAHEVIDAHGGALLLDSSPGRGCRFTLAWPQAGYGAVSGSGETRSAQDSSQDEVPV